MKALTDEQIAQYSYDGYLYPLDVLSQEEIAQANLDLARIERKIGSPIPDAEMKWRGGAYMYAPWVDQMCRHPKILDAVQDLIGPDILVFWSTFFIKNPGSPSFTAWHQDATYFGLEPLEHVTAWVALSDASLQAGCLEVLSAKGNPAQMKHRAARLKHSINGGGQTIIGEIDDREAVAMSLQAGQMSLHHTLCMHRSQPNQSDHRRIGLGISYIPTRVRPTGDLRLPALLVRGVDRYGHFDLITPPEDELTAQAITRHDEAYAIFRAHYRVQEQLHEVAYP